MELAIADVEGDHPRGAALQQAVREPSGRGSHVEAVPVPRIEREQLECVRELLAAPRDESWWPLDLEHDGLVELRTRLVVAGDEPGDDECLRLAAGLCEATLYEEEIEPLLLHRRRVEAAAWYTCGMERKGEQGTLNELEEQIVLGTTELIIRRPADVESLIDEERFADREFLPYWAELWPSGLALARFVAGLDLRGNDVLELGCGLALPSLAAALAGAAVTATDWAPESIDLIRRNAHANGLSIAAQELDWAAPVDLDRYHVVLAADVLYEERNAEPLLRLLDDAVAPGGVALFADPGRRHAQAFFDRARGSGWSLELTATDELPSGSMVRLSRSAG